MRWVARILAVGAGVLVAVYALSATKPFLIHKGTAAEIDAAFRQVYLDITEADGAVQALTHPIVGDSITQHVFDTVIGAGTAIFQFPVKFSSSTSYRVTCNATANNYAAGALNKEDDATASIDIWCLIQVSNSTDSSFAVRNRSYTDGIGNARVPDVGDTVTCNCVASGN